jgi:hypothetical protein
MRARKFAATVLAVAVPASLAAGPAMAQYNDHPVCYKKLHDNYDTTRIVLDVKFHSRLTGGQAVFEADGKHSFVDDYRKFRMAVFDGAVVTSRGSRSQVRGAHLGGESYWVRDKHLYSPQPVGGPETPIEWDCTSDEHSATPRVWYCNITGGVPTQAFNLERLDYPDRFCDVFQDTKDWPPY